MKDKVALITPSFNRAYIINETAESIFAQTHENWEWVIVDDGSTDESWDLIQSFVARDSRVKALQRNRGPKGACTCRNMAVEMTDADWLIFLDTDDLLHPHCIEQRLAASAASKNREVLYFPILVFEALYGRVLSLGRPRAPNAVAGGCAHHEASGSRKWNVLAPSLVG